MYMHRTALRDAAEVHDTGPQPIETRGRWITRIPVRAHDRIIIVPVADILRLQAEDNYVRIFTERSYLHKETLTGMMLRLDPAEFLRVHRSHAVNIRVVRELRPLLHGEYAIRLADGCELTSGRSYRPAIAEAFGLGRVAAQD
jgi:two-component system, LytTR family, response regulator